METGPNALQHLKTAIDLCFRERLIAPTLALLYSGIDTMTWLGLPDDQEDVRGEDFVQWTDRYLLPGSGITCTAVDLYSSRCGIVHSMTAESRKIRQAVARGVYFAWGNHRAENLQQILDRMGKPICAVQVDALIKAFQTAADRFMEASQLDPELGQRVSKRQKKILINTQLEEEERSEVLRRIDETNR
jgi:hypothetical protein